MARHKDDGANYHWLGFVVSIALLSATSLFLLLSPGPVQPSEPFWATRDVYSHRTEAQFGSKLDLINGTSARRRRLPQAIIIGSRKSGTRALLRFLEVNPAVRSARNEIHFFDKPQNFKRGLNWYRQQMPESWPNELTIEKSPAYFVTSQVPERIKAMNASIKLILILRDPVTRLISDFSQLVAKKAKSLDGGGGGSNNNNYDSMVMDYYNLASDFERRDLNESFWKAAERDFENYVLRPDGGIDEQRRAIRVGLYTIHLERWLNHFGREQILFLNGEQLISKPHEELNKLELFLGLPISIKAKHFVFNPRKGFFCLAPTTKSTSSDRPDEPICLSKSKGRRHIKVNDWLIKELRNFYEPYNKYLFSLTGINFNYE